MYKHIQMYTETQYLEILISNSDHLGIDCLVFNTLASIHSKLLFYTRIAVHREDSETKKRET